MIWLNELMNFELYNFQHGKKLFMYIKNQRYLRIVYILSPKIIEI